MPFVNFRKKFRFFSFDFRQNFDVWTFPRWLSIHGTKFLWEISKNFFSQNLHFGPIRYFPRRFFKILIILFCILIRDFWVIFENYSMHMLSIRGNDFIACWAYACSASGKMWTFLHVQSMLSICGTNFIAHWAYRVLISSHAEHTGNRFHRMLSMRGNV
jgi:hypothetical protein